MGRGRPSVPADVIATVMVIQALKGRSDREACRALQTDIAWKAAAGLALTDEAFRPTVLTLWRNKLRASDDPDRIFNAVRAVIAETGVITGNHRRVLDSTVLEAPGTLARRSTCATLASLGALALEGRPGVLPRMRSRRVVRVHPLRGLGERCASASSTRSPLSNGATR
jgi:hypothetical protein